VHPVPRSEEHPQTTRRVRLQVLHRLRRAGRDTRRPAHLLLSRLENARKDALVECTAETGVYAVRDRVHAFTRDTDYACTRYGPVPHRCVSLENVFDLSREFITLWSSAVIEIFAV